MIEKFPTSDPEMSLETHVNTVLKEVGLTVEDLSEKSGVSPDEVRTFITGESVPSSEDFEKMDSVFKNSGAEPTSLMKLGFIYNLNVAFILGFKAGRQRTASEIVAVLENILNEGSGDRSTETPAQV